MLQIPSREGLALLSKAVEAVVPHVGLGIVRQQDAEHLSMFYTNAWGIGGYRLPVVAAPAVVQPTKAGVERTDRSALALTGAQPIEWHVSLTGAQQLLSFRVEDVDAPTRFWIGLRNVDPPGQDQLARLNEVARECGRLLGEPELPSERSDRLRRLELAAGLVPALFRVLDVREVFERLSAIGKLALPHDALTLGVFNDDFTRVRIHATTGPLVSDAEFPTPYPPEIIRAWDFDIIDERRDHPLEGDRPISRFGHRSSLRVMMRIEDRVVGALGVLSFEPHKYTSADVEIVRRLGDFVTIALSHHALAEEGRRAAALRERARNLEMLDGLLATLMGVLDIRQVFDRVSEIAHRVLPHDALAIAEMMDEGDRVRVHVTQGLGPLATPFDVSTPDRRLVIEAGEYKLVDDLAERTDYAQSVAGNAGLRSMLVAPITVAGAQFGGLIFYAKLPGRYTRDDVMVARRIADHVALALSHQRLADQARDNESLRARRANLELLDELLERQIDLGQLRESCDRISATTKPVLPHDALTLAIILPDGRHARIYSTSNISPPLPEIADVPETLLSNPNWEHEIVDRTSSRTEAHHLTAARLGYESSLRVPIRLDGRFAGTLIFVARSPAAFNQTDVLIVRRIADRIALVLARDREMEAAKRAEAASAHVSQLESRVRALTEELDARTGFRRVVGESPEWRRVLTQAAQVAPNETTVLLLGESGTGKEVVARFVHRASPRNKGPFIALNCAALPEQLLEAELFGYERGAFTGATQSKPGQLEQAAGGTLFLDEVGEMSHSAQAKFLRVLQEREFQRLGGTRVLRTDARIIAATNRDLVKAIGERQFREDLYYRLNVFAIHLPPLRERPSDVVPLSEAFLREIGSGLSRAASGISRAARERLMAYHWPGNVRELRNILERASILCDGGEITPDHLALTLPAAVALTTEAAQPPGTELPKPSGDITWAAASSRPTSAGDLRSIEREMIEEALRTARYNKSKAAKSLGLTRQQLYLRLKRYGLE